MFTLTFNTKLDYPKMEVFSLGKQLKINCFNLKIFSNVLVANTFIELWLKSVPTWRLTKNALLQLGFVMIVRKHLELNDHYEFILCKFIKLNLFAINVPKTLVQITKSFFVIYKERILPR